ncbi:DNA-binding IclR family transcriptional regulator [Bacillus iocasae]|uniref:DNA-binding IclR family transcriptional regulator n=2 Tax=Priestia iocasae TaxID=2291674 RepID=A0ABS2QVW8_9BACI|nr:DNA-binding IclR family transcriptional regulator [Metabacillus iocasae]
MNSNKATIHRFMTTLENLGYVTKNQQDKYQIAPKFHTLVNKGAEQYNLLEIAKPYLTQFAYEINESVLLAGYINNTVYYMDKIESPSALRIVVEPGKTAPLYSVASGKLYLAHVTDEEVEEYVNTYPLTQITSNTITCKEAMKQELREIRRKGYAVDHEEWEEYLRGVAFPIYDYTNQLVSALCIAGVSYRFTKEKVTCIAPKAAEMAADISRLLGYVKKEGESVYEKK